MKKTYISPIVFIEDVNEELNILAGSPRTDTTDLTGGDVSGPTGGNEEGKVENTTDDNADTAKKNGIFFLDEEW